MSLHRLDANIEGGGYSMTKPKFEIEMRSGDKTIIWVKYMWEGKEHKKKYELVAREFGHLKFEDLQASY